jgi:hypothetical protein
MSNAGMLDVVIAGIKAIGMIGAAVLPILLKRWLRRGRHLRRPEQPPGGS